jgi:enamine deaminase RidA (YjgF/YER057c/UK114 family)
MTSITKQEVRTDTAPAPRPFYSQGVIAGDMVYVSGSLGIDPATGKMVERTIADRTVCVPPNAGCGDINRRAIQGPNPEEH